MGEGVRSLTVSKNCPLKLSQFTAASFKRCCTLAFLEVQLQLLKWQKQCMVSGSLILSGLEGTAIT